MQNFVCVRKCADVCLVHWTSSNGQKNESGQQAMTRNAWHGGIVHIQFILRNHIGPSLYSVDQVCWDPHVVGVGC